MSLIGHPNVWRGASGKLLIIQTRIGDSKRGKGWVDPAESSFIGRRRPQLSQPLIWLHNFLCLERVNVMHACISICVNMKGKGVNIRREHRCHARKKRTTALGWRKGSVLIGYRRTRAFASSFRFFFKILWWSSCVKEQKELKMVRVTASRWA